MLRQTTLARTLLESKAHYNFEKGKGADKSVLYAAILGDIPDETLLTLLSRRLSEIMEMNKEELLMIKGITPELASRLVAVFEIHKIIVSEKARDCVIIRSPDDVGELLMDEMRYLDREHFKMILLNTKNHILALEVVSIGTLNSSTVHPREIFKSAIKRSAASIILVHNHPSGDPTPSCEDIETTKRIIEAGEIIGISVMDHLIIGDGKFISLKAKGLI